MLNVLADKQPLPFPSNRTVPAHVGNAESHWSELSCNRNHSATRRHFSEISQISATPLNALTGATKVTNSLSCPDMAFVNIPKRWALMQLVHPDCRDAMWKCSMRTVL